MEFLTSDEVERLFESNIKSIPSDELVNSSSEPVLRIFLPVQYEEFADEKRCELIFLPALCDSSLPSTSQSNSLEDPSSFSAENLPSTSSSQPSRGGKRKTVNVSYMSKENPLIKKRRGGKQRNLLKKPYGLDTEDASKLKEVVKMALIKKKKDKLQRSLEKLKEKMKEQKRLGRGTETSKKQISMTMNQIEVFDNVEDIRHEKLFFDSSVNRIKNKTWKEIAQLEFPDSNYMSNDLRFAWENQIRPDIKTGPFSNDEKKVFETLVSSFNSREEDINWGFIASQLKIETKSKFKRSINNLKNHFKIHSKDRKVGWSAEENERFDEIVNDHLTRAGNNSTLINWAIIASLFPGRSKSQVYSHWRYRNNRKVDNRKPYSRAEDLVIWLGFNCQFNNKQVAQLLGNTRTDKQIANRIRILIRGKSEERKQKKTSERKIGDKLDRQQMLFEKKFNQLLEKYDLLNRSDQESDPEIPPSLGADVLKLIEQDPDLIRGCKVKPKGKPGRKNLILPNEGGELRVMARSLYILRKRRRRITSYPGDGRRFGLLVSFLFRLLAPDYDRTLTPPGNATNEELLEAGIKPRDFWTYRVMMQNIESLPPGIVEQESKRFVSGNFPPAESFLPPTLYTIHGLRNSFPNQEYLDLQILSDTVDVDGESKCEAGNPDLQFSTSLQPFGDEDADKRLYFILDCLFYWPVVRRQTMQRYANVQ